MGLVRTRECNGSCCIAAPRFPDSSGRCRFQSANYAPHRQCLLLGGLKDPEEELSSTEPSVVLPDRSELQAFYDTCRDWPQNTTVQDRLGNCCWERVGDGA